MIVIVPGIAGDAVAAGVPVRKWRLAGEIIQRQTDERLAAGQHFPWIAAALRRAFEPGHCPVFAIGDPLAEGVCVSRLVRPGDPAIVESQFRRPRLDLCDHARWVKK